MRFATVVFLAMGLAVVPAQADTRSCLERGFEWFETGLKSTAYIPWKLVDLGLPFFQNQRPRYPLLHDWPFFVAHGFFWVGATATNSNDLPREISEDEFEKRTAEFEEIGENDSILVIETDGKSDRLRKKYGKFKNARFVSVTGENYLSVIRDHAKNVGPVHRLVMEGHGGPGFFNIEKKATINARTSKEVAELNKLLTASRAQFPQADFPTPLSASFAAGAKIRISGCSTGQGAAGKEFARELGEAFLSQNGGTVYVPTKEVLYQRFGISEPVFRAVLPILVFGKNLYRHSQSELEEEDRKGFLRLEVPAKKP